MAIIQWEQIKISNNYVSYSHGHHHFHYALPHPPLQSHLIYKSYSEDQFVSNNLRKAITTDVYNTQKEILHDPHFGPTNMLKSTHYHHSRRPIHTSGYILFQYQKRDLQLPAPIFLCIRASSVFQSPLCHLKSKTEVTENWCSGSSLQPVSDGSGYNYPSTLIPRAR